MDSTTTLQTLRDWPLEQQLDFLFRAWDQLIDSGWKPEITPELKAELERRVAAYQANPDNVVTWEQVLARVRQSK